MIPPEIGNLESLAKLRIGYNEIGEIPEFITNMKDRGIYVITAQDS